MKRNVWIRILAIALILAAVALPASAAIRSSKNSSVLTVQKPPALVFERETGWASWKYVNGNLWITFKMENLDPCVDIDAFDLAIYCENAYEEHIYPSGCYEYLTFTLDRTVEAGTITFSGYCNLEAFPNARYVYAAVERYHYVKGSQPSSDYLEPNDKNTVTIEYDDLEWHWWTID